MKIKLHIPDSGMDAIKDLGLRQTNPETLKLVQGILLRGKSGEALDSKSFAALVKNFGAVISVDSDGTRLLVVSALKLESTCTSVVVDEGLDSN